MRKYLALAALAFGGTGIGGCYHATIETGAAPSTTVIEQPFASSFIYGLVPPATVTTTAKCAQGVAVVETEQSFVNGLVAILTFGIYTPMHIKVTCAAGHTAEIDAAAQHLAASASVVEYQAAFARAADATVASDVPVYVVIDGK